MEYKEYLDKFCTDKTFNTQTGDTLRLKFSLKTRLKVWLLEQRGYLVRIEVDYHYHSVYPEKGVKRGRGFGFVRIHKYRPNTSIPTGIGIEEGMIGG